MKNVDRFLFFGHSVVLSALDIIQLDGLAADFIRLS